MIRGVFIFVCGLGTGVLVYDLALERQAHTKEMSAREPYAEVPKLTLPIQCDATVNGHCYVRGMRK